MPPEGGSQLLLTSAIGSLEEGRAVVLLAAQPDPERPGEYLLEATVVPDGPPPRAWRLVLQWGRRRRTAVVDGAGCARFGGIPSAVVQGLQAGEPGVLRLRIERVMGEDHTVG